MSLTKIYGSISKVEENDDGTITVHGVASSESRDHAGEIVAADAMRGALPNYSKFPALREMHQPMAAGKVMEAEVDDAGVTHIAALVVDPTAIVKVRTGVYAGFSIGGKVLKRDPQDRSIITELRLIEISLVDSPCNPDAILSMWKADSMTDYKPESAEVIARAKTLAKAAGTQRFKEFLFEASQELIAEHLLKNDAIEPAGEPTLEEPVIEAPAAELEEPVAEAVIEEPVVEAPAIEAEETPAAEAVPGAEAEAAGDAVAEAPAEEVIEAAADAEEISGSVDPAAALADAIGKAGEAIDAAAPAAEPEAQDPFADLGKVSSALRSIGVPAESEPLAKSLYTVGRFADLLDSLVCVQRCTAWEAKEEGDNSPIPAELAAAIQNLGQILISMAQEEVGELLADLRDNNGDPIVEIVYAGDGIELAAEIVDLVKADEELMAKVLERRVQPAPAEEDQAAKAAGEELSARVAELETDNERLTKALGEAAPAVEELTKRFSDTIDGLKSQIGELTEKVAELDATPIPARTAGPAIVRAIAKGQDSTGAGGSDALGLSQEQVDEAFAKLSDQEKGELLVKIALRNPTAIKLPGAPARAA